jgi:hypothetical protein
LFGQPKDAWPCPVIPLAVNVVMYPPPTGHRRKAVESYPEDLKVVIFGTGGLSHQISGPRAGLINRKWDKAFLNNLSKDPKKLTRIPHVEYMREAGAEVEMRLTGRPIEIFARGERIAVHMRSSGNGKHTTVPDHMPSSHRRYADWTIGRIRRDAALTPNRASDPALTSCAWRERSVSHVWKPPPRAPSRSARSPTDPSGGYGQH